ncbi:S41 family peptidase [Sphingomicrobium arenosum]|uniref:S41 family peptidase n=1 Tax=Sphingomicrobium arenosum TaxID=2233861 RepID=UPI002240D6BE|nr:S41 family peptidase [Sphingomicrobium arenosum]
MFVSLAALAFALQPVPPAPSEAQYKRTERFIRFANDVRLFHVEGERATGRQAEAAFAALAPRILASTSEEEAEAMALRYAELSGGGVALGDSFAARLVDAPVALRDDLLIVDCAQLGPDAFDPDHTLADLYARAFSEDVVFDCRGMADPRAARQAELVLAYVVSDRLAPTSATGLPAVHQRQRFYEGWVPDVGMSSGGYVVGYVEPEVAPASAPDGSVESFHATVLVNAASADVSTVFAGAQAAGIATIVQVGPYDGAGLSRTEDYDIAVPTASARVAGEKVRPKACLPADIDEAQLIAALKAHRAGGTLPACGASDIAPVPLVPAEEVDWEDHETLPGLGARLTALLRLWGTIEYFNPYDALNDEDWTEALGRHLPAFVEAATREDYDWAVQRLIAEIDDSHVRFEGMTNVYARALTHQPGFALVASDCDYFVSRVVDPALEGQVAVGDRLLSIDGEPIAEASARMARLASSSTRDAACLRNSVTLLGGSEGSETQVEFERDGRTISLSLVRDTAREALQMAPDDTPTHRAIDEKVYYADLDRLTRGEVAAMFEAAAASEALILDMRGYPAGTAWVVAPRLASEATDEAVAALFRRPMYKGPGAPLSHWSAFEQRVPPRGDAPRYDGKVVVITNARAISQAEHTIMFIKAARPEAVVVGSPTNGANGDVSKIRLPGGLVVRFTAHDVRHPDGRQLQRVGIQPDVLVYPTAEGIAAGRDELLERALVEARRAD